MNDLSWFLYLADVLPRLGVLAALTMFPLIITLMVMPPKGVKVGGNYGPFEGASRVAVPFFLWLALAFVSFLVPSTDTIYLIAASEAGEMVVNTPEAREMLSDIQTILKQQIKELAQ